MPRSENGETVQGLDGDAGDGPSHGTKRKAVAVKTEQSPAGAQTQDKKHKAAAPASSMQQLQHQQQLDAALAVKADIHGATHSSDLGNEDVDEEDDFDEVDEGAGYSESCLSDIDLEDYPCCDMCGGAIIEDISDRQRQGLLDDGAGICCCDEEAWLEEEREQYQQDLQDIYEAQLYMLAHGDLSFDMDYYEEDPVRVWGSVPEVLPDDQQITDSVYCRRQPDGRHCLFGAPLGKAPKLLERIFGFKRPQHNVLLWRSELSLTDSEWRYITDALAAPRLQPLLQHGHRVRDPLPEDREVPFPARLRPRDCQNEPLRGPFVSRKTHKSWNIGRLFFSTFKDGVDSSFIWADGVKAMEPEAVESFGAAYGLD